MDEFTQTQRTVWGSGDYAVLAEYISGVGRLLVERAGVEPGMRVLDVACGTGNAAIPAARAGAEVTGLDLVPELLEAGRRKATEAGLEIEWVEGNAEELPFADGSFDRVLSTFGHMFAPRHRRTADELARVCRPGGTIGICCWTPDGLVGRTFRAGAEFMPPPPDFAQPPVLWGSEEHVRGLFPSATGFDFEEHSATIEAPSLDDFAELFMEYFPVMAAARARLGDRFGELRERTLDVWREANQATDGTLRLPQEYLLSLVRL